MPKIGVRLPATFATAGEFLADAQALEAAGADLLALESGELDHVALIAALAAVTSAAQLHSPEPLGDASATLRLLSRERVVTEISGWTEVPFPADRGEWRKTLRAHDDGGTAGLLLAMDPRLLDLLRNPDLEDDRSQDMQLAQG